MTESINEEGWKMHFHMYRKQKVITGEGSFGRRTGL